MLRKSIRAVNEANVLLNVIVGFPQKLNGGSNIKQAIVQLANEKKKNRFCRKYVKN